LNLVGRIPISLISTQLRPDAGRLSARFYAQF
jgi:hypothetical protein